ncbi:MAG TPA: hypothetical protein VG736_01205 [Vicinamibacterales bacterium]|jgi:hypothetical protein|nr:hypothetical protein [Vicinamibacterales bacterium]
MRRAIVTVITIIGSVLGAATARAQAPVTPATPQATFLPAQPLTAAPAQAPAPLPPPVFGQTPAKPMDAKSLEAFRALVAARTSDKTPVDCAMPVIAGDPTIDPKMPHEPKRGVTFLGRVIPVPPCPAKSGR